jgi:hypothetical protein
MNGAVCTAWSFWPERLCDSNVASRATVDGPAYEAGMLGLSSAFSDALPTTSGGVA